ncbi:hypothetical protein Bca52824_001562 [Brassica carinata]|uniref:Uncharacterized protein n=1 Tax=Brassica carinata TaxID=52824 RepID=A0A8X8BD68_BRACI|nr:hypothetical protein Bca52824_001562 [Brassica carinata]
MSDITGDVEQVKGGSDAARISEVKAWLTSQFESAGKQVPNFESLQSRHRFSSQVSGRNNRRQRYSSKLVSSTGRETHERLSRKRKYCS